ncbi:helix-turn-helix domain-containing protein [Agaribacterium sp. ZY112]|uniref:AraC family transcriptional regulator n=1 Tax=Agaribacterium sp. ZY112 TaxID=3233574 RepID=UPI0035231E36
MSQILFNGHDLALIITILLCVICSFQIANLPEKRTSFLVFSCGFFVSSAAIPLDILISFGAGFHPWVISHAPNIIYLFEFGAWLQAPFGFLMIASLLDKDFELKPAHALIFLPFILQISHQIILYHSLPTDVKIEMQQNHSVFDLSVSLFFVQVAREIFRVVLIMMSCHILYKHYKIQNKKPQLGALEILCSGWLIFGLLGILVSVLLLIQSHLGASMPIEFWGLSQNYFAALFYLILVLQLNRDAIQQRSYPALCLKPSIEQTPNINPEYVSLLMQLMETKKRYTDPELSQESLAQSMGISKRTLSAVINGHYGCNFADFINNYRLEEAKRLLREEKNSAVLDVMYASGFNSKATFNALFKKLEGLTPTQYRKQEALNA